MAEVVEATDTAYVDDGDDSVHLVLPDYRQAYAPNDFTDSKSRSLDNNLAEYLSKSAMRRWWDPPNRLVLHIRGQTSDPEREKITVEAYRTMFLWRARAAVHRFNRQLPLVVTLVVLGVTVLWASHRIEDAKMEEDLKDTLSGVVQVGAWVALWTAISLLFESGFNTLGNYAAFRRLARMPVMFRYDAHFPSGRRHGAQRSAKPA